MNEPCPKPTDYLALLQDTLKLDDTNRLEDHLSSCKKCERVFQELVSVENKDWGDWRALISRDGEPGQTSLATAGVSLETLQKHLKDVGFSDLVEIGRGGMGVVFKARQEALRRDVAIKMLHAGGLAGSERTERLLSEARAIGQLSHPAIVKIYAVDEFQGLPYLVLEYVDGSDLAEKLQAGPLASKDAADIARQVAEALAHAHEKNIVHRDVKPSNVLFTDDAARLADFGLAKVSSDSEDLTGSAIIGTPAYMAPEQTRADGAVGPSCDIYAVGVLLYEMLCGAPPFRSTNAVETLDLIHSQEPVSPRRIRPNIERDIETVCLKCLEKSPANRYASATGLLEDLQRFLAGQPVKARPIGPVRRTWKWAKRNPASAGLVATCIVATCLIVSVWAAFTHQVSQLNSTLTTRNTQLDAKREEAEEQKTVAVAVQDFFLGDLLVQASAEYQVESLNETGDADKFQRDPTIGWLLDRVSKRLAGDGLERRFPKQPTVQARIVKTLGLTYADIGRYEEAAEQLERALEIQSDAGISDDDENVLDNWNSLGLRYISLGRYEEAIKHLEFLIRQLDDESIWRQRASAQHNLAGAYMLTERLEEARKLAERAVAAYEKHRGPIDKETLVAKATLAQILQSSKEFSEAKEMLESVAKGMEDIVGKQHPRALSSWNKLSSVLKDTGEHQRALEIDVDVYARAKAVLGTENPRSAYYLRELAISKINCGQFDEGFQQLAESLEQFQKFYGAPDAPMVVATRYQLASRLATAKRFDESMQTWRDIIANRTIIHGEHHSKVFSAALELYRVLRASGDLAAAEKHLAEWTKLALQVKGKESNVFLTLAKELVEIQKLIESDEKTEIDAEGDRENR